MKTHGAHMENLDQIQKGDSKAWNDMVTRFQKKVMRTALAVLQNVSEADEITQEVFVRLFMKIDTLKNPQAIQPWLIKTAYHLACDHLRYQKIRRWFSPLWRTDENKTVSNSNPESHLENFQLFEVFNDWSQAHLSKKERAVFQLKIGEDLTFEEIATSLGMSISSAKTHYYRSLKKIEGLRKSMNEES